MGRRTKTTRDNRGPLQRIYDREVAANDAGPEVNDFAKAHGDYRARGKYNGARNMLVNRGGTPVARWITAGLLSDSQQAAIKHCERLWSELNGKRITANWDATGGGGAGDGWAEQEALDSLKRIKAYVPPKYWSIFEGVCRFDEPAGVAGSQLTANSSDQSCAARTTVQFVADIIVMKERLSY